MFDTSAGPRVLTPEIRAPHFYHIYHVHLARNESAHFSGTEYVKYPPPSSRHDVAAVEALGMTDSWRMLFDPTMASKLAKCGIGTMDSPTAVVRIVLAYLGRAPNSPTAQDLLDVESTLTKIRPFVRNIDCDAPLPVPEHLPSSIHETDVEQFTAAFRASGFRGGLNYYRNMDRNWQDQSALAGLKVKVPALFMIGERDTGLAIPVMLDIIKAMPGLVPDLREVIQVPGAGPWLPQERSEVFNDRLIAFLRTF